MVSTLATVNVLAFRKDLAQKAERGSSCMNR